MLLRATREKNKAYIMTILAVYQLQYLKTSEEGGRGFVGFAFMPIVPQRGALMGLTGSTPRKDCTRIQCPPILEIILKSVRDEIIYEFERSS